MLLLPSSFNLLKNFCFFNVKILCENCCLLAVFAKEYQYIFRKLSKHYGSFKKLRKVMSFQVNLFNKISFFNGKSCVKWCSHKTPKWPAKLPTTFGTFRKVERNGTLNNEYYATKSRGCLNFDFSFLLFLGFISIKNLLTHHLII